MMTHRGGFPRIIPPALAVILILAGGVGAEGAVYDLQEVLKGGWGSGKGEFGLIEREDFITGPTNFIVDYSGNVYVSDSVNLRVQRFSNGGDFVNALNFVSVDQEEPLIVHYTTCDSDGNLYVLILDCDANLVKFSRDGRKLFLRKYPIWIGRNAIYPPLSLFRSDVRGRVYIVDGSSKKKLKIYTDDGEFDRAVELKDNFSVSPWSEVFLFSKKDSYVNCEVLDMGGKLVRKFRILANFGSELTRLEPGEIYFGPDGAIYFFLEQEGELYVRKLSRDGQFLQDVPVGAIPGDTLEYDMQRGKIRGYAASETPSIFHVDPNGHIYRSIAHERMFQVLKYSPRAMRKAAIFEGLGTVYDVLRDERGRIHILADQGIYLFDPGRGTWKLQAFPDESMYRKFCFTKERGYLVYEAKRGGLLMLSEEGRLIHRVPVMQMRGIEVRGFRRFVEKEGAVFADFGSGKIYRIDADGDLSFVLDKDRILREKGAFVKLAKGGYMMKAPEEDAFDSYRVMDKNGELVGNYEFGSDTLIEDVKVVGEDGEGNIFVWCGLSRGVELHVWAPIGELAEVIPIGAPSAPVRWSDIIVSEGGAIFCVMSNKGGFEIIQYSRPVMR